MSKQRRLRRGQIRSARIAGFGVTLGMFAGLTMAIFGRGERRSRKLGPHDDRPPVRDEDRVVEPLGPGIAWGQLDHLNGRYAGLPYVLTRQIILLGRQPGCDVVLDGDRASRYHAILTWDHGHGYVQDNNSTNGTLLNGQPVKGPIPLRHGDIIEVGGAEFRFTYGEATGLAAFDAQPTEKIALPGMVAQPEQTLPRARLTALTGPEPGRVWPIVSGVVAIGRSGDNIIVLPHASVSRHHAQFVVQAKGIFIQDIGSSNGTSVNGEPLLAPRPIFDGDHIQIGDILLVVKMEVVPQQDQSLDKAPTQLLRLAPDFPSSDTPSGYAPPLASAPGDIPTLPAQQLPLNGGPLPQFRTPLPTHPRPPLPGEKRMPRYQPPRPDGQARGPDTPTSED
jgi:pSer/pThr/pTyr-binding forkhead associated (FHA) protein